MSEIEALKRQVHALQRRAARAELTAALRGKVKAGAEENVALILAAQERVSMDADGEPTLDGRPLQDGLAAWLGTPAADMFKDPPGAERAKPANNNAQPRTVQLDTADPVAAFEAVYGNIDDHL